MSMRLCAVLKQASRAFCLTYRPSRFAWLLFLLIVILLPVFAPLNSRAAQTIVVNVIVNMEVKGENFVVMEDDGDFLVRTGDLASIGFIDLSGAKSIIDNEEFISLRSMKGLTYRFNEKDLSLDLTASAELFPPAHDRLCSRKAATCLSSKGFKRVFELQAGLSRRRFDEDEEL